METDPFITAYRKLLPPPIAALAITNRIAQRDTRRARFDSEARCVTDGFVWYQTAQSDDFWYAVHCAVEYGGAFPSMKTLR